MKCPICGQQLRPGKKDPNYLLCYNCKKKYKAPQSEAAKQDVRTSRKSASKQEPESTKSVQSRQRAKKAKASDDEEGTRYSNLPPKKVREKREDEMRKAYDEMLAVGDGKSKKKSKAKSKAKSSADVSAKKRRKDYDDDYYKEDYDDVYEEDKVSKLPIIILGLAIIIVAAVIVYLVKFR